MEMGIFWVILVFGFDGVEFVCYWGSNWLVVFKDGLYILCVFLYGVSDCYLFI